MTDTAADWPPQGVELTDEKRARLAAFARECIVHSGGDPHGGECAEKVVDWKASKGGDMNKCDKCGNEIYPPEHLAQLAEYRKMVILTLDGDDTRLSKYEVLARLLPDDEDKPDTGKGFAHWLADVNKIVWVIALFFAAFVGFLHLMNWLGF